MKHLHTRRSLSLAMLVLIACAGLAASRHDAPAAMSPPYGQSGKADPSDAAQSGSPVAPVAPAPKIQLAILLDTSGSMDGLIDQAKSQIWKVVNTLVSLKKAGAKPTLEVALYHYGNDGISPAEEHVQMLLAFTTDLDEVSSKLFALRTDGGSEFCGAAIGKATSELAWSSNPDDLKLIIIAGNEPFTQGKVDYKAAVPGAVKRGIIVNTVHCGDLKTGIDSMWKDGATLGEGTYSAIETNAVSQHIESPFDADIVRLGGLLNDTYIAFGTRAAYGASNQVEQDANAATAAPSARVERAVSKSTSAYRNDSWDLVDAFSSGKMTKEQVEKLTKDELPNDMQQIDPKERVAYIQGKAAHREKMQKELGELNRKREDFVSKARAQQAGTNPAATLEDAIVTSLLDQGKRKGYER
jgi:hypothetical protein